jgi:Domain of unknown function (DUF4226)
MAITDDIVAACARIRDRTGDPNAWQAGLTPVEVAAVLAPTTRSDELELILGKIRGQHPDVFPARPTELGRPADEPPAGQDGDAAKAIAAAEAALAHQNSASSQLDLQVISAILNAHLKTVEGREALTTLQRETEAAVRNRSDLDTPAGARDFQRFLIGKLRDIRAVVAGTNLDDTSKSALMAAWTSLYDASRQPSSTPDETRSVPATPAPDRGASAEPGGVGDAAFDPLLLDDPGLAPGDPPAPGPGAAPAAAAVPMASPSPGIPNFGGAPIPSAAPAGFTLPGLGGGERAGFGGLGDDPPFDDPHSSEHGTSDEPGDHKDEHRDNAAAAREPDPPPAGPTTVTLPDGETVTAASPQLAAAIKAAAGGVPIAEAFQQQGITIPAPGTAVTSPIDAAVVAPGDIGMFTDRHALALGHDRALLDGQIQPVATVSGPSFLGWEHPPAPVSAGTDAPTPTRPAATLTT